MSKFAERVSARLREESKSPRVWHYVSFADKIFLGAVIIKAHGVGDAAVRCHQMGINPGGQVLAIPMPPKIIKSVPPRYRNRLLSKEQVVELWPDAKPLREFVAAEEP